MWTGCGDTSRTDADGGLDAALSAMTDVATSSDVHTLGVDTVGDVLPNMATEDAPRAGIDTVLDVLPEATAEDARGVEIDVAPDVLPDVAASTTGDAGSCIYDISEIEQHYWGAPCPQAVVDAGTYAPICVGSNIGAMIYDSRCGQHEVLLWSWGTHAMACYYDAGELVGLLMADDTNSFCNHTKMYIEIGATVNCPGSAQELVVYCNPYPSPSLDGGRDTGRD